MVIVVVARDLVVVIVSIAMVEIWRVARMMPQGAVVSTALVTGRETELRRFQISPEFGFHRKSDSSSMRETVSAKTPLFAVPYTVWHTNLCEPG